MDRPHKETVMKRLALVAAVLAIAACTTREASHTDTTTLAPAPATSDTARADTSHADSAHRDTTRRDTATKRP